MEAAVTMAGEHATVLGTGHLISPITVFKLVIFTLLHCLTLNPCSSKTGFGEIL